jgi:hypothetical protein
MNCYYVLVHDRLNWSSLSAESDSLEGASRPAGFYAHHYVLASSVQIAQDAAFRRVRDNLDKATGRLSTSAAEVDLEAEEAVPAPIWHLLKPADRGHTFYL